MSYEEEPTLPDSPELHAAPGIVEEPTLPGPLEEYADSWGILIPADPTSKVLESRILEPHMKTRRGATAVTHLLGFGTRTRKLTSHSC
jgi:hypothetical protein